MSHSGGGVKGVILACSLTPACDWPIVSCSLGVIDCVFFFLLSKNLARSSANRHTALIAPVNCLAFPNHNAH